MTKVNMAQTEGIPQKNAMRRAMRSLTTLGMVFGVDEADALRVGVDFAGELRGDFAGVEGDGFLEDFFLVDTGSKGNAEPALSPVGEAALLLP